MKSYSRATAEGVRSDDAHFGNVIGFALTLFILVPDNAATRWFTFAAIGASLALLYKLIQARVARVPNTLLLLVGFYFVVGLSTIGQGAIGELTGLLQRAIPLFLLGLAATNTSDSDRRRVSSWLVVDALAEAALAIVQQKFNVLPTWGWLGDQSASVFGINDITGVHGRVAGTMGHGIPLGLLLGVAVVVVVAGRFVRRWYMRVPLAALLVWGIVQTGSRSSVIVLTVTVMLMGIVLIRNWFLKLFLISAIVISLFFVNIRGLPLITSLQGTDSLTHRTGAVNTLQQLIELGTWNALFGNGWGFTPTLARAGVGSDRIQAIDNGFVSTIALSGFVGFVLLAALVVHGFRWNDYVSRFSLLMSLGMFMSFDIPLWTASFAPMIVFCFQGESIRRAHKSPYAMRSYNRPPEFGHPPEWVIGGAGARRMALMRADTQEISQM